MFNDLGKKLNDRIKLCISIKSTNLCELILAVVPLCYEFYNFYSANISCRDSISAHWPPFWILFTFWYSVTAVKTAAPVKNLMQSALRKNRLSVGGEGLSNKTLKGLCIIPCLHHFRQRAS